MHRVANRKRKQSTSEDQSAVSCSPDNQTPLPGVTPVSEPCLLRCRCNVNANAMATATTWQTPPRRSSGESNPSPPDSHEDGAESDKENNTPQLPFTAMKPVNVLISLEMLTSTFEQVFTCPTCASNKRVTTSSLEVEHVQFGLATEVHISCKDCNFACVLSPLKQEKIRPGVKESPRKRESNRFHDYSINYLAALMQQKLGIGLRGLEMTLAFVDNAPSYGSDDKWATTFDRLGAAEESVCNQAIEANLQEEMRMTKDVVNKQFAEWLNAIEGEIANEDDKKEKLDQMLMVADGKVGMTIGADGAWQKRAIGRSSYNSTTGHNFGVGGCSNKIVSLQCFSKHCRQCELSKKQGKDEPKAHRCPKNFDPARSAKSMEAQGAIQHCVSIARGPSGAYVAGVVADDDSTTRSNLRHSLKEVFNARHGVGNWNSRNKRRLGWPVGADNKLAKDTGKLPLNVPVPKHLHSDKAHRIRGVGYAAFDLKNESKIKNDKGLMKVECLNIKRNMGYYVKTNQDLPDDQFNQQAMCVVQHLFNDHSFCDIKWCTHLKAMAEPDASKRKAIDNPHKYRNIITPEEKKLYKKAKDKICPLLEPSKMKQVRHPFSTQKNESLNRNTTPVAPKDRFCGGTMQLFDRLRVIAMTDSIGEYETLVRLFKELQMPMHPVLSRWANNKDRDDNSRKVLRKKPEVKMKRAIGIVESIKEGMKQERKANSESMTYATGVANTEGDPVDIVDEMDAFDQFE